MVIVHPSCRREIDALPDEIRGDLADAVPVIGRGAHELRLKDRSGEYRVVYALVGRGSVMLVHAFKKTTRTTATRNIETARRRVREGRG